jgi:hypothetical protein
VLIVSTSIVCLVAAGQRAADPKIQWLVGLIGEVDEAGKVSEAFVSVLIDPAGPTVRQYGAATKADGSREPSPR